MRGIGCGFYNIERWNRDVKDTRTPIKELCTWINNARQIQMAVLKNIFFLCLFFRHNWSLSCLWITSDAPLRGSYICFPFLSGRKVTLCCLLTVDRQHTKLLLMRRLVVGIFSCLDISITLVWAVIHCWKPSNWFLVCSNDLDQKLIFILVFSELEYNPLTSLHWDIPCKNTLT